MIPTLNNDNCVIYLNEAFKKLKASDQANNSWYLLLDKSLNYVSKSIFWLMKNKPQSIKLITDARLFEVIIEKSMEYCDGELYLYKDLS